MSLELPSPCKVNLLLNILGRRSDGFHQLETVMHPVAFYDLLRFDSAPSGVTMTCSEPALPTDSKNLVYRAATQFLSAVGIRAGVRIHLEKRIPMAAGLGGGSGNAATTLLGLNEMFDRPLSGEQLQSVAASLGSDVPFFLQQNPALATGRGECVESLPAFDCLRGRAFLLIHPGFGIATAWAYAQLARFPAALNGQAGRAARLVVHLRSGSLSEAANEFYNSLEAPALEKYPILGLFQEFLRANGAWVSLMSGSGSTTFAITESLAAAEALGRSFRERFGSNNWVAAVGI